MAITTTFELTPTIVLDIPSGMNNVAITSLAGGGAAAIGDGPSGILGVLYDTNGVQTGTFTASGTNGSVTQLSNGNLVIASQDLNFILYRIVNGVTGAEVLATVVIYDFNSTGTQVIALSAASGGGFWILNQDYIVADSDIEARRYDNAGNSLGFLFVEGTAFLDGRGVSAAQMDNGNIAIAWTNYNGANTEIWTAIYSSTGSVVQARTLRDNTGSINRNVSLTATDTGFAIAYEDNESGEVNIALRTFDFAGSQLAANVVGTAGDEAAPQLRRLPGGHISMVWGNNSFPDTDINFAVLDSGLTLVLGQAGVRGGETASDDAETPVFAWLGGGRGAVLFDNLTDGDIDGQVVEMVRVLTGDGADDIATATNDFRHNLLGNGGNDTLTGGILNDTLDGGIGQDELFAGLGDDSLDGGDGDDSLEGQSGDDTLNGGTGNDTLSGEDGNDSLVGDTGSDTLNGGRGRDIIDGGEDNDTLTGGANNDILRGGAGNDLIEGGGDTDTAQFSGLSTSYTITAIAGGYTVVGADGTDTLRGIEFLFFEDLTMRVPGFTNFTGTPSDDPNLDGGATDDTIFALDGNDTLRGFAGNDLMLGNDGNDNLDGGAGNDTMDGGDGNDIFAVHSAGDVIIEEVGGGNDRVNTSVDYTLAAGQEVELLVNVTAGALTLTGNEFNNQLNGSNFGNDTLNGGLGNDTLIGAGGADSMVGGGAIDTYFVDNAGDIVIESTLAGGGSNDRVNATVNWTMGAGQQIEELVNILATGLNLTGNELDNRFFGGTGNDTLNGGAGNDTIYGQGGADSMVGGTGNDIYFVDNAGDVVIEAAGQGTFDRVYTSINYTIAAGQEIDDVLVLAGSGSRELIGNEFTNRLYGDTGNDTLTGNGGNDYIDGRGGNDILSGGVGIDTVVGGAGNDIFVLSPLQSDRDIFPDFNFNFDRFQVSNAEFGGGLDLDNNGVLDANRFVANATGTATSSDQRFIYDTTQRLLIFDSNGSTAGGVQVVVVTNASTLSAVNFNVV